MYSKHALGPYEVLNLHIAFNLLKNIFVCWWHGGLLHRSLEHIEKHGTWMFEFNVDHRASYDCFVQMHVEKRLKINYQNLFPELLHYFMNVYLFWASFSSNTARKKKTQFSWFINVYIRDVQLVDFVRHIWVFFSVYQTTRNDAPNQR